MAESNVAGAQAQDRRQMDEAALIAAFMAGKALCCDMLEAAHGIAGAASGETYIEAFFRDDGVPQNVFVRPILERLLREPHLLEGFAAALSSALAGGCNGTLEDGEAMRACSWEETEPSMSGPRCWRERDDGDVIELPGAPTEPPPRPKNRRGSYPPGVVPAWKMRVRRRDREEGRVTTPATAPRRPTLTPEQALENIEILLLSTLAAVRRARGVCE